MSTRYPSNPEFHFAVGTCAIVAYLDDGMYYCLLLLPVKQTILLIIYFIENFHCCRTGGGPAHPGRFAERKDPSGLTQRAFYNG